VRSLIKPEHAAEQDPRFFGKGLIGPASYLAGVAAAWFSVHAAFVIYLLTPLFYLTPRPPHEADMKAAAPASIGGRASGFRPRIKPGAGLLRKLLYWPLPGVVRGAVAGPPGPLAGGAAPVVAAGGVVPVPAVRSPVRPRPKIKASTTTRNRAPAIQPNPEFALRISLRRRSVAVGSMGSRL
jgi:hypothetical protein